LTEAEIDEAADIIGTSAIKYFDLRQNRISTYPFSYDKMLDPKGNTAVYLIYAYARICSIISKAPQELVDGVTGFPVHLEAPQERNLAITICRFPDIVDTVVAELALNKLTDLLYDLAVRFSEFYNACKVLGTPE
jgi:arginyl-tRNA synthetase